MVKQSRSSKIYFGWWIILVTGIISGLSIGFYSGISVIFKPIASELGLSRAAASVATGTGILCNGLLFVITGWLSDRLGPKWVIIAGTGITSIGLVLMNFINSAWSYYVIFGVIVTTGMTLGASLANDKMMADWFISKRGLALGTRFAIIGIMGTIVLPVMSWLSVTQGWRMTCLIWAGVVLAGIPLLAYFVRQRRPEYYGLLPDGVKVESDSEAGTDGMIARGIAYATHFQELEFTLRQALRTPTFWMLTLSWSVNWIIFRSFNVHCVPFLTDMGIDPIAAGSMMAIMVFCTIPSRFLSGIIADRVKKEHLKFLLAGTFLFMGAGITAFLLHQTIATVYIFLILFGLGNGAITPMDLTLRGRYFGRKAFGSIVGTSVVIAAPISFAAPIYTGWVYDVTGSYITAFTVFAAVAAFTAVLMCLLPLPKPPAYVGDIRQFI